MKKLHLLYLIILPLAVAVIYFTLFSFKYWSDSLGFYLWSVSSVTASIVAFLIAYTLGPLVKEIQDIISELRTLKDGDSQCPKIDSGTEGVDDFINNLGRATEEAFVKLTGDSENR